MARFCKFLFAITTLYGGHKPTKKKFLFLYLQKKYSLMAVLPKTLFPRKNYLHLTNLANSDSLQKF